MFTGLIEEIGIVESIRIRSNYAEIEIAAKKVLEGIKNGDSISTNGVCLTVSSHDSFKFTADIMPESMERSNLNQLRKGSKVNLERAMVAGGRFGGHIVSGHIDGIGEIKSIVKDGNASWVEIKADSELLRYIVFKGSVTLDGTSLTVAYVDDEVFKVSIIPVTGEETTLLTKRTGDSINIECDFIGKYVEKLIMPVIESNGTDKKKKIDENFLKEHGFF